ncbi:MAG: tetratricopeptide repeat protein [Myxococcales bacterium]|nr:tetratricopeptide repeat protein [Myxococcales bacterium]
MNTLRTVAIAVVAFVVGLLVGRMSAGGDLSAAPAPAGSSSGEVRDAPAAPAARPSPAPSVARSPVPETPLAALGAAAAAEDQDEPPAMSEDEVRDLVMQGDGAMDEGDLVGATVAFQRIVDTAPNSELAPYALYKLAWCHANAEDHDQAIADLELLLTWARSGEVPGASALVPAAEADLQRFREEP